MSYNNTKTPTRAELTGKVRWQVPTHKKAIQRKCKDGHISTKYVDEFYLEGDIKEKFVEKFPKHSNRRIMTWFGISFATLQRFKRELGLEKNMKYIRREQRDDCKRICEENGWYDSLRGKAPSEACREASRKKRAEGFHPIRELKKKNPRKYKRMLQKRSEARKALIQEDKKRIQLGLSPMSNLPLYILGACKKFSRMEVSKRYNALKRGYILGDMVTERYCIFYDQDTERAQKFEKNCVEAGFTIAPLPQETEVVKLAPRPYREQSLNNIIL